MAILWPWPCKCIVAVDPSTVCQSAASLLFIPGPIRRVTGSGGLRANLFYLSRPSDGFENCLRGEGISIRPFEGPIDPVPLRHLCPYRGIDDPPTDHPPITHRSPPSGGDPIVGIAGAHLRVAAPVRGKGELTGVADTD